MKSGLIGRATLCGVADLGATILGATIVAASILGAMQSGAGTAQAAPLDPKAVASDALWYVHVDVDAARNSPVARKIHEQMLTHERAKRHLEEMKDKYAFDPARDLHSITRYGQTLEPHQGVTVIKADVDRPIVLRQLKDKPGFKSTSYGDHDLYSWTERHRHHRHPHGHGHRDADHRDAEHAENKPGTEPGDAKNGNESKRERPKRGPEGEGDEGRRKPGDGDKPPRPEHTVTISFAKDGLVIVGHSLDAVQAGLDVVDGKTASLSPLAVDAGAGAILQAKATGLANAKLPFSFRSPLLAQTERLSVSLTDVDGTLSANAELATKSAEVAGLVQDVVAGFRALAQLRHSQDDGLKEVFNNLQVETTGSVVAAHWEMSDEQALKMHDKIREMRKHAGEHWKQRSRRPGHGGGAPGDDRQPGEANDKKSQAGSEKSE